MTPEKDDEICKKYPKIFKYRNSSDQRYPILWGISCGDGWANIIDNACKLIQHRCDIVSDKEKKEFQVSAVQIKQKFGTLRFYVTGGDEFTQGIISMAEAMSSTTCEDCGNYAVTSTDGWWMTQCEKCRSEYLKELNKKT